MQPPTRRGPGRSPVRGRRGKAARLAPLAALLVLLAPAPRAAAQQRVSVQGIVTDQATAAPIPGATVSVERAGQEARSSRTDRNGLFRIDGVAAGDYRLRIEAFGYTAREEALDLASGRSAALNRALSPSPVPVEGLAVAGPSSGAVQRELGRQTITARDIALVPTPAASGDLASYLQTVPGVISTGDRGGQLLVRGGTPSENLVLMDGMPIYQPFHITGFFSVFPEDLVATADFFPGGFGPQYSGRTSSVLDVRMRDGNRNDRRVAASLSPFLAEVLAEGPLRRRGGEQSFILSARQSLIERTSPWLLGEEQRLASRSVYVKLSSVGPDGASRCTLTGMTSNDRGGLDPEDERSRVEWSNLLVGGRCATLASETFMEARVGYSRVGSQAITRGASEFRSSADRFFMEGDASRSFGRVRASFGAFAHFDGTSYEALEFLGSSDAAEWITEAGAYGEATLSFAGRVRVLPGAVVTWAPGGLDVRAEPRLRAAWRPRGREDEELSGALGLYEQRVAGITDRRDAGSVFTFWTRPPGGGVIRAAHAQLTWQQSLGAGLSWSADAYYRRMRGLAVPTWTTVASFNPELSAADGRAHGADARVELRRGPFYGYAGYGYGWTEYESRQEPFGVWLGDPVLAFHPSHDRRHQANVLASVRLGPYTLASRWEYGSGFPFTRPSGFDEVFDLRDALPDVRARLGQTRLLVERPFDARLPAVHRLDLSVERSVDVGSRRLQLQAGVINAYDRANVFYYDLFANRRVDQLPIAPYASVKLQPGGGAR